jgi:alpha-1,6-mannosyltransferase
LFTVTGIIFRSELALLLATNTIYFFLTRRIRIQDILPAGIIGLLVGLTATVVVDSYFWQDFPLWPEFSAFKFNVVSGQASAWGVDPWYFYFVNALPRLLLNPLGWLVGIPVSLLADATRPTSLSLLVPSLAFVAIYSIQPHKEWRFIIYIIPALTAAAAQGAAYIWIRRGKSFLYRIVSLGLVLTTLASFLISNLILLPISSANYPGAQAIQRVHVHGGTQPNVVLYMGNLACQTGVTRFLQHEEEEEEDTKWTYDKTESAAVKSTPTFWATIDYAIIEDNELDQLKSHSADPESWHIIDTITSFAGFRLIKPSDEDLSSSIEVEAIQWLAGDKGVDFYKKARDGIARRYLTRGYWVEMSLEPKIRIVKHLRPN